MGASFANNHPDAFKAIQGGLRGTSQGLQQYGNPNPQFNFQQPQPQPIKKQPMQTGIQGNQNPFPSGPNMSGNLYG